MNSRNNNTATLHIWGLCWMMRLKSSIPLTQGSRVGCQYRGDPYMSTSQWETAPWFLRTPMCRLPGSQPGKGSCRWATTYSRPVEGHHGEGLRQGEGTL